ncbi:PAS domain-containing protein [Streptomyces sp. WAC05374]|uniref:PAS domain-containing protein n=1 Tax=Streptomyces sp. WAC05374 TaxID=2487420 RepID=UPI000F894B65|nr:PAS domain-containing protein [Streptomyces sp. WAC05374]RST17748.1 PAS domain-containing protein [Streptomyces sp. WAC05374]TDF47193.1 PAS domain-containing protein [Streptomyces sp. WAC05374]TDF57451.1 PAS domain-containing protein [Streptomyces sp. WAC05374]TDF61556.1 PAS domain-containing protein [Streptomyces sp. WAC05374]
MSASRSEIQGRAATGADLLAALLDGMDAALCAFDADGVLTHWNREAERILGWSAEEAVGRPGFAGWAVRSADADDVHRRLMSVMEAPGRQVHEFALLRKDGGRVLVRTQSAGVRGADGRPAGVYCAFSEVHAQIDLERSIALSEALFDDASWGVVLVDVDLRPTVVNAHAARALGAGRTTLLGRPLGEVVVQGVEELEGALHHVLAEGPPRAPVELWVTLRTPEGERRRCWRSGFLRLASPLAEEPVPLGVGWLFQDVTEARLAEQEADRLRFRCSQLHRAGGAAAECEDPMEAAVTYLDFALAGFADHALVDLFQGDRLVRAAASPVGAPGPVARLTGAGIPVRYEAGHPALQAVDRTGPVRASAGPADERWAGERQWPRDAVHALCAVLRSRGRTLGVVTFLRSGTRPAFERPDAVYAESVAVRVASAVDLAATLEG